MFYKTNCVSGAALHLLQCFVLDAKNTNVVLCRQKSVSHRRAIIFWQEPNIFAIRPPQAFWLSPYLCCTLDRKIRALKYDLFSKANSL